MKCKMQQFNTSKSDQTRNGKARLENKLCFIDNCNKKNILKSETTMG